MKNIAEKIDDLEQRRASESSNFREDIETYKEEITQRREEDLKLHETQLEEIDKKRLQEAAEYEKKELARKDSIRNSKLETEIQALRDMLAVNKSQEKAKAKQLDSTRFAMLDNELQTLRKMHLQAMLKDSVDAQKQAQAKIEAEIERIKLDNDFEKNPTVTKVSFGFYNSLLLFIIVIIITYEINLTGGNKSNI